MPKYRLKSGDVAAVTGGGSGIGRAFCIRLAELGCDVAVLDINEEEARETTSLVRGAGGNAIALGVDVRDAAAVEAARDAIRAEFGATTCLVNNAGVTALGATGVMPLEAWNWVLDVNVRGVVHGCHHFVGDMREAGRGLIINVASAAAFGPIPWLAAYNASKSAVMGMSESMHAELRRDGIGVTCVSPTFVRTNIINAAHTAEPGLRGFANTLLQKQGWPPKRMAEAALVAAQRGKLHAIPQLDAKLTWQLKRASAAGYVGATARAFTLLHDRIRAKIDIE